MADRLAHTPEGEIEVTAEMIEAGAEALFGFDFRDGLSRVIAVDVYRAMANYDPSRRANCCGNKEQHRDELLRRLLNTPPQPRPKRERDKTISPKGKKEKQAPEK